MTVRATKWRSRIEDARSRGYFTREDKALALGGRGPDHELYLEHDLEVRSDGGEVIPIAAGHPLPGGDFMLCVRGGAAVDALPPARRLEFIERAESIVEAMERLVDQEVAARGA